MNLFNSVYERFFNATLPPEYIVEIAENGTLILPDDYSLVSKIKHYSVNAIKCTIYAFLLPLAGIYSKFWESKNVEDKTKAKTSGENDAKGKNTTPLIIHDKSSSSTDPSKKIKKRKNCVSDSLFQLLLAGTNFCPVEELKTKTLTNEQTKETKTIGENQWNVKSMNSKYISDWNPYKVHPVDVFKDDHNSDSYLTLLQALGCTHYRFSAEMANLYDIETKQFNPEVVALYKQFIEKMSKHNIKPRIAAHHFTYPSSIDKSYGGLQNPKIIQIMTNYFVGLYSKLPPKSIKYLLNEPNVLGLESLVLGDFPPHKLFKIDAHAALMINLIASHYLTLAKLKDKHGDQCQKLGFTIQWLRFMPVKNNFIEKLICKIFNMLVFDPVEKFLDKKNGEINIQFPFYANHKLKIHQELFNKLSPLDRKCFQIYGTAHTVFEPLGKKKRPGANCTSFKWPFISRFFNAGATAPDEDGKGRVQSFGPNLSENTYNKDLQDITRLTGSEEIEIAETGYDAKNQGVNEPETRFNLQAQKEKYQTILKVADQYKDRISTLSFWTPLKQCEWANGYERVKLNMANFVLGKNEKILCFALYPSAFAMKKDYDKTNKLSKERFKVLKLKEEKTIIDSKTNKSKQIIYRKILVDTQNQRVIGIEQIDPAESILDYLNQKIINKKFIKKDDKVFLKDLFEPKLVIKLSGFF